MQKTAESSKAVMEDPKEVGDQINGDYGRLSQDTGYLQYSLHIPIYVKQKLHPLLRTDTPDTGLEAWPTDRVNIKPRKKFLIAL